ncbi:glycine zipper family protein [Litoribacillus peritrichatus]
MKKLSLLCAVTLIVGCSSKPGGNIIIDDKNIDQTAYESDLNECAKFADQVDTSGQVASSAGVGAIVGGVVGLIFGDTQSIINSAAAGGIISGAGGGAQAQQEKNRVVRNCLVSRGYNVLN